MVLEPLAFLTLLGLPLLLGATVLRALGIVPATDRLAYLGWAWMVGTLGTAAVLFAWLWTGLDVHGAAVPLALVLAVALAVHLVGRRARVAIVAPHPPPRAAGWETWFFRLALAFVLAVTVERILAGTLLAVVTTDEASFWAFRAKILFHEGGFGPAYEAGARTYQLGNADYPLLNPLLQLWAFVHAGRITHVVNRLPIQLFSLALVLVLAGGLRRVARPCIGALLLLTLPAMSAAQDAARLAYSDVLVALGALVALDAYLRWRADRSPAWVGLSSLAVAFLLWSKHEGALIACAIVAAVLIDRLGATRGRSSEPRARRNLLWLLPPAAVPVLTWAVNARFGASNLFMTNRTSARPSGEDLEGNFLTVFVERLPERIGPILRYFAENVLFAPARSQLVLVAFLALLLFAPRALWRSRLRLPSLALAFALVGFVLVFVGLPKDPRWHLDTAAARVVFQLQPAILLWIGAASTTLLAMTAERAHEPLPHGTRVLRVLLATLLVWRAAVAVLEPTADLLRAPATVQAAFAQGEERRIETALGRFGHAHGERSQMFQAVWRAIVDHVPADGVIHVIVARDERVALTDKLRTLTYPRRFVPQRPPPGEIPPSRAEELRAGIWVLDLFGLSAELDKYVERVTGGPGWSLWH